MIQKLICVDTKHHTYICTYIISKNVYKMYGTVPMDGAAAMSFVYILISSDGKVFFCSDFFLSLVAFWYGKWTFYLDAENHWYWSRFTCLVVVIQCCLFMGCIFRYACSFRCSQPLQHTHKHQSVYFAWFYCGGTLSFRIEVADNSGSRTAVVAAAEADSRLTKT